MVYVNPLQPKTPAYFKPLNNTTTTTSSSGVVYSPNPVYYQLNSVGGAVVGEGTPPTQQPNPASNLSVQQARDLMNEYGEATYKRFLNGELTYSGGSLFQGNKKLISQSEFDRAKEQTFQDNAKAQAQANRERLGLGVPEKRNYFNGNIIPNQNESINFSSRFPEGVYSASLEAEKQSLLAQQKTNLTNQANIDKYVNAVNQANKDYENKYRGRVANTQQEADLISSESKSDYDKLVAFNKSQQQLLEQSRFNSAVGFYGDILPSQEKVKKEAKISLRKQSLINTPETNFNIKGLEETPLLKSSQFDLTSTTPKIIMGEKLELVESSKNILIDIGQQVYSGVQDVGLGVKNISVEVGEESKTLAVNLTRINPKQVLSLENVATSSLAIGLAPAVAIKTIVPRVATGVAFAVTNPEKIITGTIQEITTKPFKFLTKTAINVALFKGASQVFGKVTTIGKTYVPAEKIIIKPVLEGTQTFPTIKNVNDAINKFNEGYNMLGNKQVIYSATDYPFVPVVGRNITIGTGRGLVKGIADVPVLYASTRGVSSYFFRLRNSLANYNLFPTSVRDLFPSYPKVLAYETTPIRIPSSYLSSIEKANTFFGKTPESIALAKSGANQGIIDKFVGKLVKGDTSKAYYTPAVEFGLKNEAEVGLLVSGRFSRIGLDNIWEKITGFKYYTNLKGTTIPIYEIENVGKGVAGSGRGLIQNVPVSSLSSSSAVSKVSLVNATTPFLIPYSINSSSKVSSVGSVKPSVVSSNSSLVLPSKSFVSSPSRVASLSLIKIGYSPPSSRVQSVISSPRSSTPSIPSVPVIPSVPSTPTRRIIVSSPKNKNITWGWDSYIEKPKPPLTPPLSIKKSFSNVKPVFNLKKSFKVSSRVKGKEKILAFGVPRNLALSIGSRFAEFTTAKSFKIKQVGFTQQQDIVPTSLGQFRLPKRGKRVAREGYQFVEKNKFAINTIGEIRGLKAGKLFISKNLL